MRSSILLLAAAVGLVSAQSITSSCTIPTSTIYGGPLATITQTYTSTYCPACAQVVTTYETVYSTFCPSGLAPATYTLTETCAPGNCRTGIPPGFTTTVDTCHVCGDQPMTATLTQPCSVCAEATAVHQYETVYQTLCPTGLAPATYTVTATCAATPCPANPGQPPQGFTSTVAVCNSCGATPVTATLTVPAWTPPAVPPAAPGNGTPPAPPNAPGQPPAPPAPPAVPGTPAAPGTPGTPSAPGAVPSKPTPAPYTGSAPSTSAGFCLFAGFAAVAAYFAIF